MNRQSKHESDLVIRFVLIKYGPPEGQEPISLETLHKRYVEDVGYLLRALRAARIAPERRPPPL